MNFLEEHDEPSRRPRAQQRQRRRRRYQAVPLPYYMVEMPEEGAPPAACQHHSSSWSFFSVIYNIFVLGTLISLVYIIFDHHCASFNTTQNLSNVTNHVEELQRHLSLVKDNYLEIESKISQISHELTIDGPIKVDGQIGVFELAKTHKDLKKFSNFDPTTRFVFVPNFDVFYNNRSSDQDDLNKNRLSTVYRF